VLATDVGADVSITSRSRVMIDALVSANDQLTISAGIHQTGVAVLVETLVLNGTQRVSGGTLDTAAGGTITVTATDSIYIKGVVGQEDLGQAKVGLLRLESTSADVLVYRNIDVRDSVEIHGGDIRVLAGSYVYATGVDSTVFLRARDMLEVSGSNAAPGATSNDALILADKLVHLLAPVATVGGIVTAGVLNKAGHTAPDVPGRILFNVSQSLSIAGGFVSSNGDIHLNAGVDMAWSRSTLEGTIAKSALIGGSITVSGNGRLSTATGSIVIQAGANVTLDANAVVAGSRSVTVERYNTVAETITTVVGYEQVATGSIAVPVVTWETTQITEIVEYKEFQVGSEYTTMDVVLSQIGYYNPNAAAEKRFVEVLLEGLDYHCENQVNQEELPDYDDRDAIESTQEGEINIHEVEKLLTPSFTGDHLEDSQEGSPYMIKICHSLI